MSFSFRDRPSLSERLRSRTGDHLLEDLEKEIEEDRKMFFDRTPAWSTTPRSGSFSRAFPFDDSPRRQDIRSHLEDLANRHPEFADHLRCPPWGGEVGARNSRWDRKQQSAEGHRDEDCHSQASNSSSTGSEGPSCTEKQGGLSHHGLRNTVDIGQQQHASEQPKEVRGQRSMSAPPPDSRGQGSEQAPPRYVTRLNITPSTNVDGPRNDQGKPPVAPKQQPPQPQHHQPPQQQPSSPKQSTSGNVRHIPIFVEGRDEPILPKNVDPSYVPKPPHAQQSPPSHTFGRPVFGAHHQFEPQPMPQTPPQNRKFQQTRSQQCPPQHSQQQPPQQPQPPPPPQMPQQAQQPPSKPQQPPANDPISRVMAVQKDVNELAARVEHFSSTSRKDKEYIYLDEMLTRNLLKLDDIETEGKENVRLARKEAIRAIQKCISDLEGKVPLPEEAGSVEPAECSEATTDQNERGDFSQPSEDLAVEQEMDVEHHESEAKQSGMGKVETMEVELSAANEPEDMQTMEVELPKGADGVEEKAGELEVKPSDTPLAAEASEIKLPVTTVQVDQTAQHTDITSGQLEACGTEKTENAPDAWDVHESKGNAEPGKVDTPAELGAANEASVTEPKSEDTSEKSDASAVKSVDEEARVKTDDVNKGSESPRAKGKGTRVKRDGVKTRKGKASKSVERKSGEKPAANETAPAEHSEVKVSGAEGQESGDVDKVV